MLGFQGNEVDVVVQFSVSGGKALLTDPTVITTELPSSAHRQIHMRTDKEPFQDKRVRQAMALLIDRRALVDGLLDTKSDYGNDSPFAPVYRTTAKVEQRKRDVAKAKELLAAAGKEDGFSVELSTWQGFEMPDLAQLIQQNVTRGRHPTSTSASPTPPPTTARPRSAIRAGSTRRWGSPSTATAGCRTCCSARR